jgi:hypothetical protein
MLVNNIPPVPKGFDPCALVAYRVVKRHTP